jgi:Zn-dependent protease
MDFFGYGIPVGRYFGIQVRLHFTFLIYAYFQVMRWNNLALGLAFVVALYVCILLHEFGHALAARWCDGEATDILLWPLGGLAFVRPAFHPTAHLITTVAGPFVTLVLWLALAAAARVTVAMEVIPAIVPAFLASLSLVNLWLLLFNLIPAFPMDGGRILRDTLWHWLSAETATRIAVHVSRVVAVLGAAYCIYQQEYWLLLFPVFIFMQTMQEQHIVALEARGQYQFSIRERWRRGQKQRAFRQAVAARGRAEAAATFHRCAVCGVTEIEDPRMDFRVCDECANGEEYCREHLHGHRHS